jgi:hypothetical protein
LRADIFLGHVDFVLLIRKHLDRRQKSANSTSINFRNLGKNAQFNIITVQM